MKKSKIFARKIILVFKIGTFLKLRQILFLFGVLIKDYFTKSTFDEFEKSRICVIRRYLDTFYANCQFDSNVDSGDVPNIIWVYWHQGIDQMPEIVRICVDSLMKNKGINKVVLITKYNLADYITIPKDILKKFETGIISNAFFSDIIRVNLLSKYGGLWIDSTVYVAKEIDLSKICNNSFFTVKNDNLNNKITISDFRWTTFFMVSPKNMYVFGELKEMMYFYIRHHSKLIDYLLIDFLMDYIYRHDDKFSICLDRILPTNPMIHTFVNLLDMPFDMNVYDKILEDSFLFKLNYRLHPGQKVGNRQTFFGYLKNNMR